MHEQIKYLIKLQELDLIKDSIEARLDEIPHLIEKEEEKSREAEQSIESVKEVLKDISMQIKNMEIELLSAEEFIKKQSTQLNTLKSNEAYSKMQKEISGKKKEVDDIEEQILELSYSSEGHQEDIKRLEAELQEKRKVIQEEQARFKQEIDTLQSNKKQIEEKILPVTENIDNLLLEEYRQIRSRRSGIVLVAIDDSSCGGCHLQLPPQVVNEVLEEKDVVRCENCTRFLYSDPDKDD